MEWDDCGYCLDNYGNSPLLKLISKPNSVLLEDKTSENICEEHYRTVLLFVLS